MKLLGADADLSAKAELSAIGKAGRRIDIDGCRVNPVQKFLSVIVILRDDRFGMTGIVTIDMADCLIQGIHQASETKYSPDTPFPSPPEWLRKTPARFLLPPHLPALPQTFL